MIAIPDPVVVLMDGDPLLRTMSTPVMPEHFGTELNRLLVVMGSIAKDPPRHQYPARGLAAIQIGVPLRVLIIGDNDGDYMPFINPEVTRTLNRNTVEHEGCLSVPRFRWGDVSRPAKCDAKWQDPRGQWHSATLTSGAARIFLHELDHLNGVLMTDRRLAA